MSPKYSLSTSQGQIFAMIGLPDVMSSGTMYGGLLESQTSVLSRGVASALIRCWMVYVVVMAVEGSAPSTYVLTLRVIALHCTVHFAPKVV